MIISMCRKIKPYKDTDKNTYRKKLFENRRFLSVKKNGNYEY